jgi:hypothetical protein
MADFTVETPVDTDTKLHLLSTGEYFTLAEILNRCNEKWGEDLVLENISICAASLRTRSYSDDPEDRINYENFLVIEKENNIAG